MSELPYVQLLLRHGIKSFVYAVIERDGLPLGVVLAGDNEEEVDLPEDAAILLLDPYSGNLRYEQSREFHSKDSKSIILPQGKGYGGRAAMERQTIQIADLSKVEPDPVQGTLLAEEGFAAYFAVPLIVKGTVKGVLEVYHREPVETNSNWLAFMETLAGQTANAVDNAELLSRLESSSVDLIQAYDATIEG